MNALYAPIAEFSEVTVELRRLGIPLPKNNAGKYVWDFWQACALLAGVKLDASEVGRQVICSYYCKHWPASLDSDVGVPAFEDMIFHALVEPEAVTSRWNTMMERYGKHE